MLRSVMLASVLGLAALGGCSNEQCKLPEGVTLQDVTELRSAVAAARSGDSASLESAVSRWSQLPVERGSDGTMHFAGAIVEEAKQMKGVLESDEAAAADVDGAASYAAMREESLGRLDGRTAELLDACK